MIEAQPDTFDLPQKKRHPRLADKGLPGLDTQVPLVSLYTARSLSLCQAANTRAAAIINDNDKVPLFLMAKG